VRRASGHLAASQDQCLPKIWRVDAAFPWLSLFGVPVLRPRAGEELVFTQERPFQVLAYLACRGGWVTRDEVATWLWPERSQAVARSNLRKVLLLAQRLPLAPALESQGGRLRWPVPTDVASFDTACAEGRWHDALALHRGPLLEGMEHALSTDAAAWLALERERVLDRWRAAAAHRLDALRDDPREAAALAEVLVGRDPTDETFVAALVHARIAQGQHAAAAQALRTHARRLAEEFGVEPSAGLRALAAEAAAHGAAQVAAQSAAQSAAQVAAQAEAAERVAAPLRLSPAHAPSRQEPGVEIVGRRLETQEATRLLLHDRCRLLTIVGPGGVGKSRFARAWVDALPRAGDAFTATWWLALADLRSVSEVPGLAAARVGFELKGGDDAWLQLARHVGERRLLVALDNVEHLAAELAPRLVEWTAACPQLHIVCTSRRRLLVDMETAMPLEGLPLPDADETDPAVLSHNDAVRLFVQRAHKASPRFELAHDAGAVVRLIQRVEGLPLAIELAAAWVRVLPVADIVAELEQSPALLAAPGDETPGRDRSLRASFEHSWHLLTDAERRALAALARLPAAFDRRMAMQVADAPPALLLALADKSLLRADGQGGFSLHPLVRACAAEKPAAAAVAERHAGYITHWLKQFENRYALQDRAAQAEMDRMLAHVRAAWDWTLQNERAAASAVYSLVVSEYFRLRGLWPEGLAMLERTVRVFDAGQDPARAVARTRALLELAVLRYHAGQIAEAETACRHALRLAAAVRDEAPVARLLVNLGNIVIDLGRPEEAGPLFERAVRWSARRGEEALVAVGRLGLGTLAIVQGRLAEALPDLEASLPAHLRHGNVEAAVAAMNNIGSAHFERQDFPKALQIFEQELALCERHGLSSTRAYALTNIALCELELGRTEAAAAGFARALEDASAHGEPFIEAHILRGAARCALASGLQARACELAKQALVLAVRLGVPALQAGCALTWAQARALQESPSPVRAQAFVRSLLALPDVDRDDRRIGEQWLGAEAAVAGVDAERLSLPQLVDTVLGA
jgi:predicted ATPase/DNA-binding SARP family transcriptional activator